MKKAVVIIILLVLVTVFAGCVDTTEMEKVTPTPTLTPTPELTPTPTPAPEVAKMGDWISDGRISICVNSFRYATLVGKTHVPDVGNIYLIVDVSVKNVGTEIIHINPFYVFVADSDGYEYGFDVSTYRLDGGMKSRDLTPDRTMRFEIAFEIPKDATPKEFIWDDWSTVGVIQLQR